ncbi:hypothetical protein F4780DRAFT_31477 [Xylariomycetidae sp. FL0641]|nr:hypothetical protein F4780DRAFT_31477 [Xylariomycetidae sp. FL0641]
MAAAIEAIGVISGVLGIIQFGMDNFPAADGSSSKVRVAVGLDTEGGLQNGGGDLPDVRIFNEGGGFLGLSPDPGTVGSGGFGDVSITHDSGDNQQATYALFSANDDAICVAFTSITWPDDNKYSWIGDWGRQCGGSWYYSNLYIQGTDHKPDCLWIDANGDQPQTGFQVHWPEFSTEETAIPSDDAGQTELLDRLCGGIPFGLRTEPDPSVINYWVIENKREVGEGYGAPKHARSAKFGNEHMRRANTTTSPVLKTLDQLVIDDDVKHSAQALCDSATSVGPNMYNVAEGKFCRMTDKTVWSVCDETTTDNCFNADVQQVVANGLATRDAPYSRVINWTGN